MTAATTFQPVRGVPPSIEWVALDGLQIDPHYQRSLEAKDSTPLIRQIATHWDWRLCAPLTVSRRIDPPGLYVIDGQHRLSAARMRGDIPHLPCIVSTFGSIAEEARCFVAVNTKRKRVTPLDTFRAQLAAGDASAVQVSEIIHDSGLSVARHSNHLSWKPGQISCVSGVRNAIARHGVAVTRQALGAVAAAWPDEILQYAGRILAGLYPLFAKPPVKFDPPRFATMMGTRTQSDWFGLMLRRQAKFGELPESAMQYALSDAWQREISR
jgi:hypothetical protein